MQTKQCTCCKEVKILSDFYIHRAKKSGFQSHCKNCDKVKNKTYRDNNKNKITERNKVNYENNKERWQIYHQANKDSGILKGIRQRSKKKGIECDLELEDIAYPEFCPVLGLKLERKSNNKGPTKNSPSVDRIDPTKGYVKDNIQMISNLANTMKQDATPEQLLMFADWVIKTYRK